MKEDLVNHPKHYTSHPSGVECIAVTEHMGFNLGNAMKYIWRCDEKWDTVEDLKKAIWYIEREVARRETKNGTKKCKDERPREPERFEHSPGDYAVRLGNTDYEEASLRDAEYFVQRHETR